MKQIVKNPEPTAFIEWKSKWETPPGWAEFDGTSMKQQVKSALLEEQGYLCCFCESRVGVNSGHIAHLFDRCNHPDLVLSYKNLLYSCRENPRGEPQTCGHSQGNKILPISPLDDGCETSFAYSEDGYIHGKDNSARDTIHILNLNGSNRLRESRRKVYEEICDNQDTLSPDEFARWITSELNRQSDGMFKEYWTTKKYAAGLYT